MNFELGVSHYKENKGIMGLRDHASHRERFTFLYLIM